MVTEQDVLNNPWMQEGMNELVQEYELYRLAQDLQQTDKFKKVGINNVAISKIPYVKYPGISVEDCITIHDLAQEVLFISMTENNNNEVAITFSLEHEKLKARGQEYKAIVKGNETEIDLGADTATCHLLLSPGRNVLVSLHNHPAPMTFSIFDIMTFIRERTIGCMIVVTNKGELYYMSKDKHRYGADKASACLVKAMLETNKNAYDGKSINLSKLTKEEMLTMSEKFLYYSVEAGVIYKHARNHELAISQEDIENAKIYHEEVRDDDRDER